MTLFLIIVFGIYFLLLTALMIGWEISTRQQIFPGHTQPSHFITVIIPFRNEEHHLGGLAADLASQVDLPEGFTVLFVDDHSTDNSARVLDAAVDGHPNFRLLTLPPALQGKKRAIDFAVRQATGSIIVTTDADCRVSATWLSSIRDAFHGETTQMVFGGVKILTDASAFSKLQSLEFSSVIGSGVATLGLGFPTMCNGANLAYRKSAYMEVGGFEGNFEVASGDDEFLMRKIHEKYSGGISFLRDPRVVVSTRPQPDLKNFVSQRLRWAGKWKYNSSSVSTVLALFVLLFHATFVVLIGLAISGSVDVGLAAVLITGKILPEFIFLRRVNAFLNQPVSPFYFLLLQFIHPPYVIVIGFLSQIGTYSWKGRSLKHKL